MPGSTATPFLLVTGLPAPAQRALDAVIRNMAYGVSVQACIYLRGFGFRNYGLSAARRATEELASLWAKWGGWPIPALCGRKLPRATPRRSHPATCGGALGTYGAESTSQSCFSATPAMPGCAIHWGG